MTHRRSHRRLTGTRIYVRRQKYYYFSPEPICNPKTGRTARWHSLCPLSEGESHARGLAQTLVESTRGGITGTGDFGSHMQAYLRGVMEERDKSAPDDPAKLKMHRAADKEIRRICAILADAFGDFNVAQIAPTHVAQFLRQWKGLRMAQVYRSRLSDFMVWCIEEGARDDNPCTDIRVKRPAPRRRYMTDDEFHKIRDHLAPMPQCYVDLCYLLYQRTTDLRLLRKDQIRPEGIYFQPTKTERSSGARVLVPMTPDIMEVLMRAKACGVPSSPYIIHTDSGTPYTTTGIWSAWRRARIKAGIGDVTLKDLRAKAITDADAVGYELKQIRIGAAHTSEEQTQDYIKRRKTPVSEVVMHLPKRRK